MDTVGIKRKIEKVRPEDARAAQEGKENFVRSHCARGCRKKEDESPTVEGLFCPQSMLTGGRHHVHLP